MPELKLSPEEKAGLDGARGEGVRLAMQVVVTMGKAVGARQLRPVSRAHVDGCLYHGRASLDFADRLARAGARVTVPTTLNVGSLDLLHPSLFRGDPGTAEGSRRLMDAYVAMGCRPTWTCAPYQVPEARPTLGEHVAWAESNAIVFANSVLGARTDRYGDFMDVCAAITGLVPDAGLHHDAARRGRILFRLDGVPDRLLSEDVLYPVLGHLLGAQAGTTVPVIDGLPPETGEDALKALGAAAASSGAVALFHAVGITPEASTLEDATGGAPPERIVTITLDDLRRARDDLGSAPGTPIQAVSLGTPHYSVDQLERLSGLVEGTRVHPGVAAYVSTGRDVLEVATERGWAGKISDAGWRIVTDTCTYVTPILEPSARRAMTDSGKWAYYAPGNLGIEVAFGGMAECVRSAVTGQVVRDPELWGV